MTNLTQRLILLASTALTLSGCGSEGGNTTSECHEVEVNTVCDGNKPKSGPRAPKNDINAKNPIDPVISNNNSSEPPFVAPTYTPPDMRPVEMSAILTVQNDNLVKKIDYSDYVVDEDGVVKVSGSCESALPLIVKLNYRASNNGAKPAETLDVTGVECLGGAYEVSITLLRKAEIVVSQSRSESQITEKRLQARPLCYDDMHTSFSGEVGVLGDGTEALPFLICNETHFARLHLYGDTWGLPADREHFKLMADIDLSGQIRKPIGDDGLGEAWYFYGVLDGNGRKITGVTIDAETAGFKALGLFARIKHSEIKNLIVENISILHPGAVVGKGVGGLAGMAEDSIISNVHVTGVITTPSDFVGGLVGTVIDTDVKESSFEGLVSASGGNKVGGLIGSLESGNVSKSYAKGSVKAKSSFGGLVGSSKGHITSSFSTSDVTELPAGGGGDYAGGLVGISTDGSISRSYATGAVNAATTNYVGGFIGEASHISINKSYYLNETQSIAGTLAVGGFVGLAYDVAIAESYAIAAILNSHSPSNPADVGGLAGFTGADASYADCFWDKADVAGAYSVLDDAGVNQGAGSATDILNVSLIDQNSFSTWDFTNDWQMLAGVVSLRP